MQRNPIVGAANRWFELVSDYTVGLFIVVFQETLAGWQGLPRPGTSTRAFLEDGRRRDTPTLH